MGPDMGRRRSSGVEYPWYDSLWLSAFEKAQRIVRESAPHRLDEFKRAFDVFRTHADFRVRKFSPLFDDATLAEIRRVVATLMPQQLELHEARSFKRFVVHDHTYFNQLQDSLVELVGEAVGEPVEGSYNFLSLYGPEGVCPIHMDAPQAKWTVDLCIDQTDPWPIHFSPVVPWPVADSFEGDWQAAIKVGVGDAFTTHTLKPGEAVVFAGSSQWHYRDPMPGEGPDRSCDLLFFHFIPRGTADLVNPANWARLFQIPALAQSA